MEIVDLCTGYKIRMQTRMLRMLRNLMILLKIRIMQHPQHQEVQQVGLSDFLIAMTITISTISILCILAFTFIFTCIVVVSIVLFRHCWRRAMDANAWTWPSRSSCSRRLVIRGCSYCRCLRCCTTWYIRCSRTTTSTSRRPIF